MMTKDMEIGALYEVQVGSVTRKMRLVEFTTNNCCVMESNGRELTVWASRVRKPVEQLTLDEIKPSSRRNARATSRAAEKSARYTAKSMAGRILLLLSDGVARTDPQIASELGVSPRLSTPICRRSDLVRAGFVEMQDEKGVTDTGCACARWAITGIGLDWAEKERANRAN